MTQLYRLCHLPEHRENIPACMKGIEAEVSPLCEYPMFVKAYDTISDVRYGLLSAKFQAKTNLTEEKFLEWIDEKCPESDVYFINPCPLNEALWLNTVQQGRCHPELPGIFARTLPEFDQGSIMTQSSFALCNYFVANRKFWKAYLDFGNRFLGQLSPQDKTFMYDSSANYGRNQSLPYYPFVMERLFSVFLSMKHSLRVSYYRYTFDELVEKYPSLSKSTIKEIMKLSESKEQGRISLWEALRYAVVSNNPNIFNME